MWAFVLRRLALGGVTVLVISFIVFTLSYFLPVKVYATLINRPNQSRANIARILHHYGADKSFAGQYETFLQGLSRPLWSWAACPSGGDPDDVSATVAWSRCAPHLPMAPDLGFSPDLQRPVLTAITQRAPQTVLLMGVSYVVQLLVAIPIGIFSAVRQYSKADNVITFLSFLGISLPNFWFASILIYVFALPHDISLPLIGRRAPFPVGTYTSDPGGAISFHNLPDLAWHLVLPATVLAVQGIAVYARFMRSSMLDSLGQDYVRTARAKGLSSRAVILRHALRNSLLPLITLLGLDLPQLFAGAVITETIFNWGGMGQLFVQQTQKNDTATMLGILVLLSVLVVAGNLIADLAYTRADPRISYSGAT